MTETPPVYYCANHPTVETTLRCNRCEKPICVKCARLTPTGYRCLECIRGQQKIFDTSVASDYIVAAVIAAGLAFVGSLIIPIFWLLVIFLSPIAGTIIAEAVRFAVHKRRSLRLYLIVAVATALGCVPLVGGQLIRTMSAFAFGGTVGIGTLFSLALDGLYAIVVTATAYYRLSGMQIRI